MLLKEFLDNINNADDEFTMSAIVDENSNSDAPNAKYVLKKGDNVIGTYDNSVRAKEGYEAAKALVGTPIAEEPVEEPVEEPAEEPADDSEEVLDTEHNVYDEVEPVEEPTEDLPSNEE